MKNSTFWESEEARDLIDEVKVQWDSFLPNLIEQVDEILETKDSNKTRTSRERYFKSEPVSKRFDTFYLRCSIDKMVFFDGILTQPVKTNLKSLFSEKMFLTLFMENFQID